MPSRHYRQSICAKYEHPPAKHVRLVCLASKIDGQTDWQDQLMYNWLQKVYTSVMFYVELPHMSILIHIKIGWLDLA